VLVKKSELVKQNINKQTNVNPSIVSAEIISNLNNSVQNNITDNDNIDAISKKIIEEIYEDCLQQINFENELEFHEYSHINMYNDSM